MISAISGGIARTARCLSRHPADAFVGRADPDPKGFAWLATLIGLFESGYISSAWFASSRMRSSDRW